MASDARATLSQDICAQCRAGKQQDGITRIYGKDPSARCFFTLQLYARTARPV